MLFYGLEVCALPTRTLSSNGFRGGRAGSAAPLGQRTDAVTVVLISENATALWRVLNFDRSTVKPALQNTQNDCHQWLSDSSRVYQIRFRPGLGEFTALPRDPSLF